MQNWKMDNVTEGTIPGSTEGNAACKGFASTLGGPVRLLISRTLSYSVDAVQVTWLVGFVRAALQTNKLPDSPERMHCFPFASSSC